ncbi:MAG: D-ribose ABC transporter substrate-binding protein [Lachnospiraceae bacterium]
MTMKKVVGILLAAVLVVGVMGAMTGCNAITIDGEEQGTTLDSGNGAVGFSVSTLNNPFFVSLADGAKKTAKKSDVKLVVVDAGDDAAKQTSDIEDLISRNVSVIIVNPVDSDAVAPAVKNAMEKGIKVISVDRVVNGVDVDCQIASDNVAGAEMATKYLEELIGKGAKVAEIQGVTGASATIDRGKGFHNIADKELKVVASQSAEFNRAKGMTVMENILQSDSSIKGVFAHNDEMALGAAEAVSASGKDIKVVGFDATDDATTAIKSGKMSATVAQKPDKMGETAVATAIQLIKGDTVVKSIPVEVELVK